MPAQTSPQDDSRLLRSIPPARLALIEKIAAEAKVRGDGRERNALRRRFVHNYFRGVGEEDLAGRSPGLLAATALAQFELGSLRRVTGQSRVRVFNPDPE